MLGLHWFVKTRIERSFGCYLTAFWSRFLGLFHPPFVRLELLKLILLFLFSLLLKIGYLPPSHCFAIDLRRLHMLLHFFFYVDFLRFSDFRIVDRRQIVELELLLWIFTD